jgi:hypothetical protein
MTQKEYISIGCIELLELKIMGLLIQLSQPQIRRILWWLVVPYMAVT